MFPFNQSCIETHARLRIDLKTIFQAHNVIWVKKHIYIFTTGHKTLNTSMTRKPKFLSPQWHHTLRKFFFTVHKFLYSKEHQAITRKVITNHKKKS